MAQFGIGQAVRRTEDPRLVTGRGRYTDDITLPGQLQAYFLRSPVAHGTITELDVGDAAEMDGVHAVLTIADLEDMEIKPIPVLAKAENRDGSPMVAPPRHALAKDVVRHVGEPIALVVAETLAQAKDAAEAIMFDFDTLPALADMPTAVAEGAPRIWDEAPGNRAFSWAMGDESATDAAFAAAAHTVTLDLVNNRLVATSMEGRACNADYSEETGRYTLYVSSQGVHGLKRQLAGILGVEADRLHVLTTDVGGGFGMKLFNYPEYVATMAAARKLGRAVKWTSDRSEAFLSDDHGRDHLSKASLALDSEGRILGLRVDTLANLGAYLSNFSPFVATSAGSPMLPGLYKVPAFYNRVDGVFTNTQPVDAYRGAGRPEAAYVIERLMDAAARQLGVSPVDIRMRNYPSAAEMPFTSATGLVYDSGDFAKNLTDAVARSAYKDGDARKAASADVGKYRGLGISTYVEVCGGGGPETATVEVARDGKITVLIGTQSNGQGHDTAYRQLVAQNLGVELDEVTIIQGDSDRIATGAGTGGSRSLPVGGASLAQAAIQVQEAARLQAAELLEAAADDVVYQDGRYVIRGTDRSLSFQEVAAQAEGVDEHAFLESYAHKPPAGTFPNGAHICEVEIDPDTGIVEIVRYTVVDDFGVVINPLLLEGQVHGGIGQGIGQALHEQAVYDEDAQLLSGSFMDYSLPRADHLPYVDFTYNVIPCTTNPLGIKGAGEAGAIGAPPAVINAVIDALAPLGITHIDMPATPLKIWTAIQEARSAQAAE